MFLRRLLSGIVLILLVLLVVGTFWWYSRPPTPFGGRQVQQFEFYFERTSPMPTEAQLASARHVTVSGPQIQRLFASCRRDGLQIWAIRAPGIVTLDDGQRMLLTWDKFKINVPGVGGYYFPRGLRLEWTYLIHTVTNALEGADPPNFDPPMPNSGVAWYTSRAYPPPGPDDHPDGYIRFVNDSAEPVEVQCRWVDVVPPRVEVGAEEAGWVLAWPPGIGYMDSFSFRLDVRASDGLHVFHVLSVHALGSKQVGSVTYEPRLQWRDGELTMIWESDAGDRIERVFQPVSVEVRDTTTQPGS